MTVEHVPCPYCGEACEHTDSVAVYSRSYGMIYLCKPCDAYVGVHKHNPYKPLGTPADRTTRAARKKAHAAFDPMWQGAVDKYDARRAAYRMMQDLMDLPAAHAHIAMFSSQQCILLVHLLQDIKPFD